MKSIIPLLLFFLLSSFVYCQEKDKDKKVTKHKSLITVTDAESQKWSGGVAGRKGCIYSINFYSLAVNKDALPETIWIGLKSFPVQVFEGNNAAGSNCKLEKGKDKWLYSFVVNDDQSVIDGPADSALKKVEVQPKAPVYKGAAAICYTYKHRKRIEPIEAFKQKNPINYP